MEVLNWALDHMTAFIAAGAVVSSILNRNKLKALHVDLNSRLTQLLEANSAQRHAEGIIEGKRLSVLDLNARTAERERVEDRADDKITKETIK